MTIFQPHHLNANSEDFLGNQDIGRYIFLPGSDERAKKIAEHFLNLNVKQHPRGHHLYLGQLKSEEKLIDVASVSTGMGCPSMEIILHELYHLGAKRFIRVGTAGSLQKDIHPGSLINVQAAVRDDHTSENYAPLAMPAIASLEVVNAINQAALNLNLSSILKTGIVQCKASLYAGEFGAGPQHVINEEHLTLLSNCGVLASEMETASLFTQAQIYNHEMEISFQGRMLAGCILGIVSDFHNDNFESAEAKEAIKKSINLALETVKVLYRED